MKTFSRIDFRGTYQEINPTRLFRHIKINFLPEGGDLMFRKLFEIYQRKIRPRAKKILIGLLIFFVLFTVIGFFGLPPLLKYILTKELSQNLHREVTIKQITFNP